MECRQFLQLVRKYPTTGSIPVIVLVPQRPDPAALAKLRELAVREFVARPFTLRLLRDAVARAHPDGPARAGSVLGTSSAFALPPVEGPDPDQLSMEHDAPADGEPKEVEEPGPAPVPVTTTTGSFLRPAAVVTVQIASGPAEGRPVEVERYTVEEVAVRTRRFRLARGEDLRLEVLRREGDLEERVRLMGHVTASRWAFGGGRATVQLSAALPADGAAEVGHWLAEF